MVTATHCNLMITFGEPSILLFIFVVSWNLHGHLISIFRNSNNFFASSASNLTTISFLLPNQVKYGCLIILSGKTHPQKASLLLVPTTSFTNTHHQCQCQNQQTKQPHNFFPILGCHCLIVIIFLGTSRSYSFWYQAGTTNTINAMVAKINATSNSQFFDSGSTTGMLIRKKLLILPAGWNNQHHHCHGCQHQYNKQPATFLLPDMSWVWICYGSRSAMGLCLSPTPSHLMPHMLIVL